MKKILLPFAFVAALGTTACSSTQQNTAIATLGGGALGAVTAAALGGGQGWIIAGGVAGAAAGALYARNARTNECAYSNGNGTYSVRKCPS